MDSDLKLGGAVEDIKDTIAVAATKLHGEYSVTDPLRNGFLGANSIPSINGLEPVHPIQQQQQRASSSSNGGYYPTEGLKARAMGSTGTIHDALFAHSLKANVTSVGARSLAWQSYTGALESIDHEDWLAVSDLPANGLGAAAVSARLDANLSQ